jgi:hypothetical protein
MRQRRASQMYNQVDSWRPGSPPSDAGSADGRYSPVPLMRHGDSYRPASPQSDGDSGDDRRTMRRPRHGDSWRPEDEHHSRWSSRSPSRSRASDDGRHSPPPPPRDGDSYRPRDDDEDSVRSSSGWRTPVVPPPRFGDSYRPAQPGEEHGQLQPQVKPQEEKQQMQEAPRGVKRPALDELEDGRVAPKEGWAERDGEKSGTVSTGINQATAGSVSILNGISSVAEGTAANLETKRTYPWPTLPLVHAAQLVGETTSELDIKQIKPSADGTHVALCGA